MSSRPQQLGGSIDTRRVPRMARGRVSVVGSLRTPLDVLLNFVITVALVAGLLVVPPTAEMVEASLAREFMTASGAPAVDAPVPEELSQSELADAVATAKAEWEAAVPGADLSGVSASIADLPDLVLGAESGGSIQIDVNAAGHGWGPMSLITVVRHELGHVLGEDHSGGGLMEEYLSVGESYSVPAAAPVVESTDLPSTNVDSLVTDPITDPVVVDPLVTDPIVDPLESDPIVDPLVTDPLVTDPVVDPLVVDPAAIDPLAVDAIVDPVASDPLVEAAVATSRWTVVDGVATASAAPGESLDVTIRYNGATNSVELVAADGTVDSVSLEGVTSVAIAGGAGDDTLTVSTAGGTLPVPVAFDGGPVTTPSAARPPTRRGPSPARAAARSPESPSRVPTRCGARATTRTPSSSTRAPRSVGSSTGAPAASTVSWSAGTAGRWSPNRSTPIRGR